MITTAGVAEDLSAHCRTIAGQTTERGIAEATARALRDLAGQVHGDDHPADVRGTVGFIVTSTAHQASTTATSRDGSLIRLRVEDGDPRRQLESLWPSPALGRPLAAPSSMRHSAVLAPVVGQDGADDVLLAPLLLSSTVAGAIGVALPHATNGAGRAEQVARCLEVVAVVASTSLERVRTPPWQDDVVRHLSDIVVVLSDDGLIRAMTPNAAAQLGHDDTVLGEPIVSLMDPRGATALLTALGDPTRSTATQLEMTVRHRDGYDVLVEATLSRALPVGDASGMVLTMREVGDRRDLEEALTQRSLFDTLTGLPNRTNLRETMAAAASSADPSGTAALLLIDLDDFKAINDSFGHVAGDDLLRVLGVRLSATAGPEWTVARLGGDEFALFGPAATATGVEALLSAIGNVMDQAVELREGRVRMSAGVGAYLAPGGTDPRTMLLNADLATWTAKHRARTGPSLRVSMYDEEMTRERAHQAKLRSTLRDAVDRGEFELFYQQEIGLTEADELAFEALLRWNHPDGERVSPGVFIPLAEDLGLMPQIGEWVLRQACADGMALIEQFGPVRLAVNVSATQLAEPDFLTVLRDALDAAGFPPELLILEMTESVVAENPEAMAALLAEIRDIGILVAVDDFGTGYSSLSYLQDLPVDILKIDRAFVSRLDDHDPESSLVAAVTRIADSLGLKTVAEGVETAAQLQHVRALGVDMAQGYLHGRPIPLREQLGRVDELRPGLHRDAPDVPDHFNQLRRINQ